MYLFHKIHLEINNKKIDLLCPKSQFLQINPSIVQSDGGIFCYVADGVGDLDLAGDKVTSSPLMSPVNMAPVTVQVDLAAAPAWNHIQSTISDAVVASEGDARGLAVAPFCGPVPPTNSGASNALGSIARGSVAMGASSAGGLAVNRGSIVCGKGGDLPQIGGRAAMVINGGKGLDDAVGKGNAILGLSAFVTVGCVNKSSEATISSGDGQVGDVAGVAGMNNVAKTTMSFADVVVKQSLSISPAASSRSIIFKGTEFFMYAHERRGYYNFWQHLENEYHAGNLLMVTVTDDESRRIQQQSDDDIKAEIMTVLRKMFGNSIPEMEDILIPKWGEDRFYKGTFSNWPIGVSVQDFYELKAPVGPVFFTGEHTSQKYNGYVHGAYLAGIKTAKMVVSCMRSGNCANNSSVINRRLNLKHTDIKPHGQVGSRARRKAQFS